jgi:competence protein ComEC
MAGDSNNNSVVLRVAWNQVSFLLTGDVEEDGERQLVESGLPLQATVLKVAHHGSAGSSTAEFLQAVQPSFAVISVGADNRAGHPAPAMLDRLAQLGKVELLRTDERGTVEFITDGRRLWVRTER